MCKNLEMAPVFDMFASWHHHQLPRYFSDNINDTHAEEYNASTTTGIPMEVLYMNPPWSLLDQVVGKIIAGKSTVLLVTPRWCEASWYKKLTKLRMERRHWNQALYLDKKRSLQKSPRWATVFTFIPGRDAYKTEELPTTGSSHPPRLPPAEEQ